MLTTSPPPPIINGLLFLSPPPLRVSEGARRELQAMTDDMRGRPRSINVEHDASAGAQNHDRPSRSIRDTRISDGSTA